MAAIPVPKRTRQCQNDRESFENDSCRVKWSLSCASTAQVFEFWAGSYIPEMQRMHILLRKSGRVSMRFAVHNYLFTLVRVLNMYLLHSFVTNASTDSNGKTPRVNFQLAELCNTVSKCVSCDLGYGYIQREVVGTTSSHWSHLILALSKDSFWR